MSLQKLLSSIHEIAEQKIKTIIEEAKRESEEILAEANRRADAKKKEIVKIEEERLESRERSELAMEELKWKRKVLESKAEILDRIFAMANNSISQIAKESRYREFINDAIVEAVLKILGSEYTISTNERDDEILQKDLKNIENRVRKVRGSEVKMVISKNHLDSIGGVLVSNKSMQEYFNNTIEARLLQSQTKLRGRLYKELFGG